MSSDQAQWSASRRQADYGSSYPGGTSNQQPTHTNFVPYCLLSLYADTGYKIYAEGFAAGELSWESSE